MAPNDWDARSVSVRLDGKASIEHQLDIHVLDLVEARQNEDIAVLDVLHGLNYVLLFHTGYGVPNSRWENAASGAIVDVSAGRGTLALHGQKGGQSASSTTDSRS